MKAWLKFELKSYKYIIIGMILFVYAVLLPYTLQMLSFDNELEIERIFTEIKYSLALLEVMYLYMFLRYILGGECLEVIFSIRLNKKYIYMLITLGSLLIGYSPLFTYYYRIAPCLYDILDCIFLLIFIAHLFYVVTFISKSILVSSFNIFIFIIICNHSQSNAIWNIFHPMIRPIYINDFRYVIYICFIIVCTFIAIKLENSYIE